jgi:iron complex outermembrane receptor protein
MAKRFFSCDATWCAVSALVAVSTPSWAQSGEEQGGLTEVNVTAERFGSSLQRAPVAVTAINPEILAERQVSNVLDAASEVPGLVITPTANTTSSARIVLRGAGQENPGINFDQAVGVYIDNVYQPRVNGAFFDFFDIAQLEVLRGPQGTLYGRNNSGGAIKITSKRPSLDWTGMVEASAGNWSALGGKAYLSGPIVDDKLAFSISGMASERDGFLYGVNYGRRIGNIQNSAERVKLLFTPTDNFEVQLAFHAIQDYSEPAVGVPLTVLPGVIIPEATGGNRNLTVTENLGAIGDPGLNNTGASLNAIWSITDALDINLISGYGNLRTFNNGSVLLVPTQAGQQAFWSGTQAPAGTNQGRTRSEWLSQEINATYTGDRLKGVVGVYYYDEEGMSRALSLDSPTIDQDREVEAWAAFAQGTYNITESFGVTAGLRYTHEEAGFTQFFRLQNNLPQSDSKTFTATTPKFGVNWQISPNIMTYASYTRGFKSGGFNPVPPNANTGVPDRIGAPTPYDPEEVDSYEVGAKFMSADRSVRLNVAIFQAEYEGMQLPVFFPGTTTSFTSNATGSRIRGIELEPAWQVFDDLQLYGNMSFSTGKYTEEFLCSDSHNIIRECSANKIKALVPEQVMLGFAYSPEIHFIPGQLRFNGSWSYHSHYFNNVANEGPLVQTPAAGIYNASIGWTDPSEHWKVALEGRNLADKHYVLMALQSAHATQPAVTAYPNAPRQIMMRASYSF